MSHHPQTPVKRLLRPVSCKWSTFSRRQYTICAGCHLSLLERGGCGFSCYRCSLLGAQVSLFHGILLLWNVVQAFDERAAWLGWLKHCLKTHVLSICCYLNVIYSHISRGCWKYLLFFFTQRLRNSVILQKWHAFICMFIFVLAKYWLP
jgi:hypothetical protein